MTDCKCTFLLDELPLTKSGDFQLLADDAKSRHQEITGALVYLQSRTRPDLCISVLQLARHVSRPTKRHMSATKRAPRSIQGTRHASLTYQRGHFKLHGYADAANGTDEAISSFLAMRLLAGHPTNSHWSLEVHLSVN
ncbi:unnamed protein product [Discosporangium mesarthrocarpum]